MFSQGLFKVRSLVIPITVLVLSFGFFCTDMFHDMSVSKHTAQTFSISEQTTVGCCGTSLAGHLNTWKTTSLFVIRDFSMELLILVVSLALAIALWRPIELDTSHELAYARYRAYLRQYPDLNLFDQLQLAFSSGILHPKTY